MVRHILYTSHSLIMYQTLAEQKQVMTHWHFGWKNAIKEGWNVMLG